MSGTVPEASPTITCRRSCMQVSSLPLPTGPHHSLLLGILQQNVLLTSRLKCAELSCMSAWDALRACRRERACSYMGCMATQAIGETPLSDPTTEQKQAHKALLLMWHVSVCCLCTAQVVTKHRLPFPPLWNPNCQLIRSQRAGSSLDGSRKVVIHHARERSYSQMKFVLARYSHTGAAILSGACSQRGH